MGANSRHGKAELEGLPRLCEDEGSGRHDEAVSRDSFGAYASQAESAAVTIKCTLMNYGYSDLAVA